MVISVFRLKILNVTEPSCEDFVKRILLEKYGANDVRAHARGAGSEYSQLLKSCKRGGQKKC